MIVFTLLLAFIVFQDEPPTLTGPSPSVSQSNELTSDEVFEVLEENETAIAEFAATLKGTPTDREVVVQWMNSQPINYSGRLRDRINNRRNKNDVQPNSNIEEPEEKKKRRRLFDPDKPGIIEKIKNRERLFNGSLIKKVLIVGLIVCGVVVFLKIRKK